MQISARDQLPGTVKSVNTGAVHSEVVIDIGGVRGVAVITNDSYAVVKATDAMVAVD